MDQPQQIIKRDLRIDFLRGLALFIIFIDHSVFRPIPGFKWLADFTFHRYFWMDCAEVFVFLSGYVAGTVYSNRYARFGLGRCLKDAGRRCLELYVAQVALFAVCLAVVDVSAVHRVAMPALFSQPYSVAPLATSWKVLTLSRDEPFLFALLPLYIAFVALAPFAVALAYRSRLAVAGLSVACWLSVQVFQEQFDLGPMDLRAWQFLFFAALLLANQNVRNPGWWRSLLAWRWWAVAGLGLIAITRILPTKPVAWLLHSRILMDWIPRTIPLTDKQTLGPLRLVNLALFVLALAAFDWARVLLRGRIAQILTTCGQSSLIVYCAGVVLNYLGVVFLIAPNCGKLAQLLWIVGGSLLLAAVGVGWQHVRNRSPWPETLPLLARAAALLQ